MTLFFNLKTLQDQSCNKPDLFMSMLYYHWNPAAPLKRNNIQLRSKVPLTGYSFLLNPEAILEDTSTDVLFKVQYIKLAGMRNYLLYKQYKYTGLQTSLIPDLAKDNIKYNPLLIIKPTEILFKYE